MPLIITALHALRFHLLPLATMTMVVSSMAVTPATNAATFNTEDVASHDHWQSMTLSLGGEQHYRAVETHSYSDATLSLNTSPGVCDLPWLEMRVTLEQQQGESRTVNLVPTRLRIDEQPVIDTMAEFITERGDDGFYTHFYLSDLEALIADMRQGEQLFLGFDQEEREPWYMTFSLQGADAAITRMLTQCEGTEYTTH
ncbi:hypothetical protein [Halomonas sp. SpR8]|uniref:hypothetical protein n=1 Tax=Halomonas sp. SpR8 TaxID=3050463 RepID=UPI0027E568BB|nr:hypothetical protein [Halomonas sp. SpR8]MDQ7730870.1 hypothetical protein [Halomonas sp. SpR8]